MCYARILPIFFYSLTLSCSPYIFFIFLLIQRPPTSTLFPSRRSSDLERIARRIREPDVRVGAEIDARHDGHARRLEQEAGDRSEEHTSELQSQFHLVCRLLLEKKNKIQ